MAAARAGLFIKTLLAGGVAFCLMGPKTLFAQDPERTNVVSAYEDDVRDANKSYAIPAFEIVGFDFLLNRYNRQGSDGSLYDTTLTTIKHNLKSRWVVDQDPFKINQFFHPYQGAMYHQFARSAGLGFWQSAVYTFAGSALWEIAGETTPPSRNDQVASGIGGIFLGEPLYRIANLLLERGGDDGPRFGRKVGALIISPATGINRMAFNDRFDGIFSSHEAAHYSRLSLGAATTTQSDPGPVTGFKRNEVLADFSMDYGLPGKPGYTYKRPFDYFNFQVIASSANGAESVMTRGLVVGKDHKGDGNYRSVWGLYGTYDYLAPQFFRVSSTALSFGTTADWRLAHALELHGTGLLGTGYTAVGSVRGTNERDNHYGVAPQAMLALRLVAGNRASLDIGAHDYFVSNLGGAGHGGRDNIARADASLTMRIYRRHGLTIKYLMTRRDARFPNLGNRTQTRETIGLFYTFLGHEGFGSVDWPTQSAGGR